MYRISELCLFHTNLCIFHCYTPSPRWGTGHWGGGMRSWLMFRISYPKWRTWGGTSSQCCCCPNEHRLWVHSSHGGCVETESQCVLTGAITVWFEVPVLSPSFHLSGSHVLLPPSLPQSNLSHRTAWQSKPEELNLKIVTTYTLSQHYHIRFGTIHCLHCIKSNKSVFHCKGVYGIIMAVPLTTPQPPSSSGCACSITPFKLLSWSPRQTS